VLLWKRSGGMRPLMGVPDGPNGRIEVQYRYVSPEVMPEMMYRGGRRQYMPVLMVSPGFP